MDQNLDSCIGCYPDRVFCGEQKAYGPIAGRIYHSILRIQCNPIAQGPGSKHLIHRPVHGKDFPLHGRIQDSGGICAFHGSCVSRASRASHNPGSCLHFFPSLCILLLFQAGFLPEHNGQYKRHAHGKQDADCKIQIMVRFHGNESREPGCPQCLGQCPGSRQICASHCGSCHGCIKWIF